MLVSGFPGRGYLSAASPMLVALCTCVWLSHGCTRLDYPYNFLYVLDEVAPCSLNHFQGSLVAKILKATHFTNLKVVHNNCKSIAFMFNGGSCSGSTFCPIDTRICIKAPPHC